MSRRVEVRMVEGEYVAGAIYAEAIRERTSEVQQWPKVPGVYYEHLNCETRCRFCGKGKEFTQYGYGIACMGCWAKHIGRHPGEEVSAQLERWEREAKAGCTLKDAEWQRLDREGSELRRKEVAARKESSIPWVGVLGACLLSVGLMLWVAHALWVVQTGMELELPFRWPGALPILEFIMKVLLVGGEFQFLRAGYKYYLGQSGVRDALFGGIVRLALASLLFLTWSVLSTVSEGHDSHEYSVRGIQVRGL